MFTAVDQYNVHSPLVAITLSLKTFLIWWRFWALAPPVQRQRSDIFGSLWRRSVERRKREKRGEYFVDADSIYSTCGDANSALMAAGGRGRGFNSPA